MNFSKNEKNGYIRTAVIIIIVAIILAICIVCLQSSMNGDGSQPKEETKKTVSYVTDPSIVTLNENINTLVTNEKCNKSSIRRRFSLNIQDGKILVTNIDTMENFLIDKISDATNIVTVSYSNSCDKNIYAILNREGQIFITDNEINTISDVKKIEQEFYVLTTDLRFDSIMLGTSDGKTDLYGKTSTNNLYKIDLR